MKKLMGVLLLLCLPFSLIFAQTILKLEDLSDFQKQDGNWKIVGKVMPPVPKKEVPSVDLSEKKKKKGKRTKSRRKGKTEAPKSPEVSATEPEHLPAEMQVSSEAGTGILLNINNDSMNSHLLTKWEHGDIQLSCEVLIPKGSNSGIYLQGRYEVQLFDSWGIKNPSFSDMGGIYRNWHNEPGLIYRGKAPASNPSKAPGLWQQLDILFQAPKFDGDGKKIRNAKLVYVDLNGVRIHQNVELPLPTGGPISEKEVPKGPLMIQGDHGAVAFRNISYTLLEEAPIEVQDVSYKAYEGRFLLVEDYASLEPVRSGKSLKIDGTASGLEDNFGLIIDGQLKVDRSGEYDLTLSQRGGAILEVDGKRLVDYQRRDAWDNSTKKVSLTKGLHPFRIYYYKSSGWLPTGLGLKVKTEGTYEKDLHLYESYPTRNRMVSQIHVEPGSQTRLHRGFVDFDGDRKKRLTHTIAVGNPEGTHYIFDTKSAHVVCFWRGDFVNATPMWHDRGDGSFRPRGAAIYTFPGAAVALGDSMQNKVNFGGESPELQPRGYRLPEPSFQSEIQGHELSVKVWPAKGGKSLMVEVGCNSKEASAFPYYKLAEGKSIEKLADGRYAIDDFKYFIRIHSESNGGGKIQQANGKKELFQRIGGGEKLIYELIW